MTAPDRKFMAAVNDPKAHAPPEYQFEPAPVDPRPTGGHGEPVVYPVLPGGLLNYRPPLEDRRQLRPWVHAFLGFSSCAFVTAACSFVAAIFLSGRNANWRDSVLPMVIICLIPLAVFVAVGLLLRSRGVWYAFLPAALAGWACVSLLEGWCFLAML